MKRKILVVALSLCSVVYFACSHKMVESGEQTLDEQTPATSDDAAKAGDPVTVSIKTPAEAEVISTTPYKITADASGGTGIAKVEFYKDAVKLGEDADAADGFSFDWPAKFADDGAHKFKAIAYDSEGTKAESAEISASVKMPTFAALMNKANLVRMRTVRVLETKDGGAVVLGDVYEQPDPDSYATIPFLMRFDRSGSLLWQKALESEVREVRFEVTDLIETNDGDFLILGNIADRSWSARVTKVSSDGNIISQKKYNTDGYVFFSSIQPNTDGTYTVLGQDLGFMKLNNDGGIVEGRKFEAQNQAFRVTTILKLNDGYFVSGSQFTVSNHNDSKLFSSRFDDNWNLIWAKTYNMPLGYYGEAYVKAVPDKNGGVILYCRTDIYVSGSYLEKLIKLNSTGDVIWAKDLPTEVSIFGVDATGNGEFVLAGSVRSTRNGTWSSSAWIASLGSNGDMKWQRSYGTADTKTWAQNITGTADGGYYVTGVTANPGNEYGFLLKLNPDGTSDASCANLVSGQTLTFRDITVTSSPLSITALNFDTGAISVTDETPAGTRDGGFTCTRLCGN